MINISQSFLKEFAKYKMGETCGLQVKAKYVDGVQFPSSDAMELGNYFEYQATGCLPRSGNVPEPKMVYKGTARESLATDYQRANESALFFKKIVKEYNIELIELGKVVTHDGMTGIMDIVAKWNNRICIIDTKYSGLVDDKWSDFGWNLDALPEKHGLMIQGVHYRILLAKELEVEPEDIDFYYFVFSTKNPMDVKIIQQLSDETTFSNHLASVEWIKRELQKPIDKLFKAIPTLMRCHECPLKDNCKSKVELPTIDQVTY